MKTKISVILALSLYTNTVLAALITFDSILTNSATPDITTDSVTVSFDNLMTIAEHSISNGFGGRGGSNAVIQADRANFSGNFITAMGFRKGEFRGAGFTRTISFSSLVSDVSMYIADIDLSSEDFIVRALDGSGNILSDVIWQYPYSRDGDARATLVDFTGVFGISSVQIIGDDPVGIDNLSFAPVPLPASVWILGSGLIGLFSMARRRKS